MRPSIALADRLEAVLDVIATYPVSNPRVFGSVARGEDLDGSDVDILVDPAEELTLFDLAALEAELSLLLGCVVEVTSSRGVPARSLSRLRREWRSLAA